MKQEFALTDATRVFDNRALYRIKTLKDFADIKAGTLGGFIEHEINLSHNGDCLVADNAYVLKPGRFFLNACVFGNAVVGGFFMAMYRFLIVQELSVMSIFMKYARAYGMVIVNKIVFNNKCNYNCILFIFVI